MKDEKKKGLPKATYRYKKNNKTYNIRIDRIVACLVIIVVLIVLICSCAKSCGKSKDKTPKNTPKTTEASTEAVSETENAVSIGLFKCESAEASKLAKNLSETFGVRVLVSEIIYTTTCVEME